MSFQSLKVDELKELAAFYGVEPKVADPEHGATKKELLAALAEDEVSKEDYDTFVEAKEAGDDKTAEQKAEEAAAEEENPHDEEAPAEESVTDETPADESVVDEADEEDEDTEEMLIRMIRKNGTYETHGLRFTKDHPFKSVPVDVAEDILENEEGFRQARPSEVKDYYN